MSVEQDEALRRDLALQLAHVHNTIAAADLEAGRPLRALIHLHRARAIYGRYPHNLVGVAECLTHVAHAYDKIGKRLEASLALAEAETVATASNNQTQLARIQFAAVAAAGDQVHWKALVHASCDAARAALAVKQYDSACIRLLVAAQELSKKTGQRPQLTALRLLAVAGSLQQRFQVSGGLEGAIGFSLGNSCWRLGYRARAREALERGAASWLLYYQSSEDADDMRELSADIGDHFRLLARILLDAGEVPRSLLVLEVGRAVAHCVTIDRLYMKSLVSGLRLTNSGISYSMDMLERMQGALSVDAVALALVPLPPELVCYVVTRDQVTAVAVPLPNSDKELEELLERAVAAPVVIPGAANAAASVPRQVHELAVAAVGRIGSLARVEAIAPHAFLHSIPWRSVLSTAGLSWERMPASIAFNLLLHSRAAKSPSIDSMGCIALAHGVAAVSGAAIDFVDEAQAFAAPFPRRVVGVCTSHAVREAIQSSAVVLVSCHGSAQRDSGRVHLALELADGLALDSAVFPERASARLVVLSACDSGVYLADRGDFPVGAGPRLVQSGVAYCIGARFKVKAAYAKAFCERFAILLIEIGDVPEAFANTLRDLQRDGWDSWKDLGCLELIGDRRSA